jgi:L-lactate dehydrogenase complex protein LldG
MQPLGGDGARTIPDGDPGGRDAARPGGVTLFDAFAGRAREASAEVIRVATAAAAREAVVALARAIGARRIVAAEGGVLRLLRVREALREAGMDVTTRAAEIRDVARAADLGVSAAAFGVAETGSVCHDATAVAPRLVSLVPPVHVVFLASDSIVPGIAEALDHAARAFERGSFSFITGPSRTADIERVLTIGVHGPARLVIIAIDTLAPGVRP